MPPNDAPARAPRRRFAPALSSANGILALCWLTYAAYYLGRVNLAVALPVLGNDLGWSPAALGLLGSVFYWVYAAGQLVNGALGDRLSPRRLVAIGLLLSGVLNILVGASSLFGIALLLWGLNGWAQSTGWGPLLKTLSRWFSPQVRGRVTALFSPCYVVGHAASWALAGWLASRYGWRSAFWVPGVLLAVAALVWYLAARDAPDARTLATQPADRSADRRSGGLAGGLHGLAELWRQPLLRWALITCLLSGMVKDGLTLWAPTYLVMRYGLTAGSAALTGTVIPLAGAAGAVFAGWLVHRRQRESGAVLLLAPLIALAAWALARGIGSGTPWTGLPLLALIALGSHGINALLMSAVPLALGPTGRVSSAAGALDFASYVGGGFSALIVGGLQQVAGWPAVFAGWTGVATLIAVAAAVHARQTRRSAAHAELTMPGR